MKFWKVRMYLLGFLMSPDNIAPSVILEEILLVDTPGEVVFKDEHQHREFMECFLGPRNCLIGFEGSSSRYPKLSPECSAFKSKKEKIAYIEKKSDEVSSFFGGLYEYGAGEYLDQNFDLYMAQANLSIINDVLTEFCLDYEDRKKVSDSKVEETLAIVHELHDIWPEAYQKISRLFLQLRRGELKIESLEEIKKKLEQWAEHVRARS